jgi:hypothetical protein
MIDMCSYIVSVIIYETSDSFAEIAKHPVFFFPFSKRKKITFGKLNIRQGNFFLFSYFSFHKINTLYLNYCIFEVKYFPTSVLP